MSFYKAPFSLGNLVLSSNVFCSPLAGCSDFPFRKMIKQYNPGLMFCEMVKMDAMVRNDIGTFRLLDYDGSMHPIGAQLCGSNPKYARTCAKIIEDLGFDVIDLNCGCPVDKITKDQSGSALLKNPPLIGEILAEMIAAVKIPVTVKIRIGWDDASINCVDITELAEQAGAKIIFVHGRTRQQAYVGPANWDYIKACKEKAKTILVFGNGDIVDAKTANDIFLHTACDGILLSRGTFGTPWVFEDIARHFQGESPIERTGEQHKEALLLHLNHILHYKSKNKAAIDLRRIGGWYLKKGVGIKRLKEAMIKAENIDEAIALIQSFSFEETDCLA